MLPLGKIFGGERWKGDRPHPEPLVFLNGAMAIREDVLGHTTDPGYRWASGFFGLGLIDRTSSAPSGIPLSIQDPIPMDGRDPGPLDALCDARGAAIVAEARERDVAIRLLWSGGIDSTAAAVSLLRALDGETERLEIGYTGHSIAEYRAFYRDLKRRGIALRRTSWLVRALRPTADDTALLVTGEHGDQIFGSMLAEDIPPASYHRPWQDVLPAMVRQRLGKQGARMALDWLEDVQQGCPIPADTAFDRLWWWNFALKWQTVTGRISAPLKNKTRASVEPRLRHFFRTDDFQRWALTNPDKRIRKKWASYKWPLKDYIFDHTGDEKYRKRKCKVRSLRNTLPVRYRAYAIDEHGQRLTQKRPRGLVTTEGTVIEIEFGDGE